MILVNSAEEYLAYRQTTVPVAVACRDGRSIPVPAAQTILAARHLVVANTYNPNHVSDDKMQLLYQSITDNGFAFPIVVIWDDEQELFVVVDGFHRYTVSGDKWLGMSHVPLAVLSHDAQQRMIATWQFNKARGAHEVDLDADLIRALIEQGMEEADIAQHLGIDLDTVHRYKQVTGIAELFKGAQYSMAWHMEEVASD
jgi:ParB-like chromosome segregation protein Spo0J